MKSEETTATADWLGVFEGVLNATRATFVEGNSSVWDYANPEHFSSLWKSLEDESVKNASRVLILWSQTPPDESLFPVNTVEHVSPLHWAACAAKKCPQIQVCVLDLNPTAHRSQYLYEHYLSCEKRRLSWMRVVQAAHFFGSDSINGEFQPDATPVEIEALERRLFPQAERKRGLVLAGHFVDRIRNELTSPQNAESRHAISNIIGPMVLRSGRTLPGETSSVVLIKHGKKSDFPPVVRGTVSHQRALNSILRTAGLMCAQVSEDTSGARTPADSTGWLALDYECEQAGINPAELRITLVDDQWSQGWLAWIKEGLGPTPVELQVSPDPLFLLQLLRATGSESRQFSLSLDVFQNEKRSPKQDILLLDLRLFTGNSTAEREFLIALDAMLNSLPASGTAAVDRKSVSDDLEVVRRRLEVLGGSGIELSGADHARYVTLLPRLIAQLDFSLPIIIFSSTGQRDVEKQFKNVPSIISDFSKPRHFQGADEDVIPHAENALAGCVAKAICCLRGRKLVQQIQSRPLAALETARKRCAGFNHFELYFDESGTSHQDSFLCAAMLIGYKTSDDFIYDKDAQCVSQLIQHGDIQFWNEKLSNGRTSVVNQWETKADQLADIIGKRPVIPFVISRTPQLDKPPNEFDLAHPDSFDNALFDLVELLLEIVIIEVLPVVSEEITKATLHVYGATRLQKVVIRAANKATADAEADGKWRILHDQFGIQQQNLPHERVVKDEETEDQWSFLYRSLWADSFLPALARSLGNRCQSKHIGLLGNIIRAVVGVQLPKTHKPDAHVRHQHYICDRLAFFSTPTGTGSTLIDLRAMDGWKPLVETGHGFLGRRSRSLLDLVNCARQLDARHLPTAFALGEAVLAVNGIFAEALASRLQSEVANLSASSFIELCGLANKGALMDKGTPLPADRFWPKPAVSPSPKRGGWQNPQSKAGEKRIHTQHGIAHSGLMDLERAMDEGVNPTRKRPANSPPQKPSGPNTAW